MKVLIAEGDEQDRTELANLLRSYGHEVAAVDNGESVLKLVASKEPYDYFIFSYDLPRHSGLWLLRAVRHSRDYPDAPCVVMHEQVTARIENEFRLDITVASYGGVFYQKNPKPNWKFETMLRHLRFPQMAGTKG